MFYTTYVVTYTSNRQSRRANDECIIILTPLLFIHTYHSRFIPKVVADASQVFLWDAHVLPKCLSYEEYVTCGKPIAVWSQSIPCASAIKSLVAFTISMEGKERWYSYVQSRTPQETCALSKLLFQENNSENNSTGLTISHDITNLTPYDLQPSVLAIKFKWGNLKLIATVLTNLRLMIIEPRLGPWSCNQSRNNTRTHAKMPDINNWTARYRSLSDIVMLLCLIDMTLLLWSQYILEGFL
jgi:hypothetical protein